MTPSLRCVVSALIMSVLRFSLAAQAAPPAKPVPAAKQSSCAALQQASYAEGLKQGKEDAYKDGWSTGFSAGTLVEQTLYSVKVSDSQKIQDIAIVVEDIDGATSYQFAAAEVIRTYFGDMLSSVPSASLTLHIGGTRAMALSYGGDIQSVDVEVSVPANQTLQVGTEQRLLYGHLQLAFGGGTLRGYSQTEKTQAVREYIYKVLSEYRQAWDKAAPKTP
jgi:hypothetical protein